MAWRDNLRSASFRGVSFGVESHRGSGGRRNSVHEFPNREDAYIEDLGGKNKTFSLEAFVVGDDYFSKRDSLIAALDKEGPGTLIHPYLGEIYVQVDTWDIAENYSDGRMAKFSINFLKTVRSGTPPAPGPNTVAAVSQKANVSRLAAAKNFANKFKAGLGNVLAKAQAAVSGVTGLIKAAMSPIATLVGAADQFTRDVNKMIVEATTALRQPLALAYQVQNTIDRVKGMPDYAMDTIRSYKKVFEDVKAMFPDSSTSGGVSAQNQQIRANNAALRELLCVSVVASASESAAVASYTPDGVALSDLQVEEIRSSMLEMYDYALSITTDDEIFAALMDLKVSVMEAIRENNGSVKERSVIRIDEPIPALLAAYNIYGDADKADEIVSRNNIRHPGMITGGSEIEVIL